MGALKIQVALQGKGFKPGPIDGVMGPRTEAALIAFKQSIGFRARAYIGPLTRAALFDKRRAKNVSGSLTCQSKTGPTWLRVAYTYLGLAEVPGPKHHPKILEWWKELGLPFVDDETPWCAAFVNGVVLEAGGQPATEYRAAARGWDWTDTGIELDGPKVGAIVTFWRGAKKGGKGHIGFVVGRDYGDKLMVLGGNQGNKVSIRPFDTKRVLSFRWPAAEVGVGPQDFYALPKMTSDGKVSENEV